MPSPIDQIAGRTQNITHGFTPMDTSAGELKGPAPPPTPPAGPTTFWQRIAAVGIGKVTQLTLAARMAAATATNNTTAFKNANQANNQNNAKLVANETGNLGKGLQIVKGVAQGVAQPFEDIAKKGAQQVKYLAGSSSTAQQRQQIIANQQKSQQAKTSPQTQTLLKQSSVQGRKTAEQGIANNAPDKQVQGPLKQDVAAVKKQNLKAAGTAANLATMAVGGGEAKAAIQGAKEAKTGVNLIKSVAKGGAKGEVIGAGQTAASQIEENQKINPKQVAQGAALGFGVGAGGRILFDKIGNKAPVKSEVPVAEAPTSRKITVADNSTGTIKGKVSESLPQIKPSNAAERPSAQGYDDTNFRLQFNKGAKQLVDSSSNKWTYFDKKLNKVEDPLSRVVNVLSHTNNKGQIRDAVENLLPEIDSSAKNRLVRDIGNAKDHQEVADHLWDAAKNHEANVNAPGTPTGKKISFTESNPKVSELGGDRPNNALQTQIEGAHAAGDTKKVESLIQQLPDASTRDSMRSSVGLPTTETKLVTNPDTQKTERVPIATSSTKLTQNDNATKRTPANVPGTTKVSGSSVKIEKGAVEQGLTKRMEGLPEFDTINKKDQAQKVADFINGDRQKAIDVIDGKTNAPSGIHPVALHNGLVQLARKEGDAELITKLARSDINKELSKSAQNLSVAAERDPHDPVELVRQVMAARTKAVETRGNTSSARATSNLAKEIDKAMKRPSKLDWQSFIESIKC